MQVQFLPIDGASLPGTSAWSCPLRVQVALGSLLRFTASISTVKVAIQREREIHGSKALGLVPKAPGKGWTHFSFQEWIQPALQIFFPALPNFIQAAMPRFICLSELTLSGCCGLMLNFIPEKQTETTVLVGEVLCGFQGPAYGLLIVAPRLEGT